MTKEHKSVALRVQDSKMIPKSARSEKNISNRGIPDPEKKKITVSKIQIPELCHITYNI